MGPVLWLIVPLVITTVGAVLIVARQRVRAAEDPQRRKQRELAQIARVLGRNESH